MVYLLYGLPTATPPAPTSAFLSSLQSHCTAEMDTAASKVPGLNLNPCPMSLNIKSPSDSRSKATNNICLDMSMPTQ